MRILCDNDIPRRQWKDLADVSPVTTWFQTTACYDFYESLSFMNPFAFAVEEENSLRGVVVGYITQESNPVKQYFTRRAIVVGGPLLAETISDKALALLLMECRRRLEKKAIYIEMRNFNGYTQWEPVFSRCDFQYHAHLNFHVDTTTLDIVNANLGKSRKRDIKTSLRDGAAIVESPTLRQVKEYYTILVHLYKTRVKTPLFPWEFFEKLYALPGTRFLLVKLGEEIIGGTVCVGDSRTLYEWFACGKDGVYKNIYPSTLATYAGIKYAAENHYTRFDMMGAGKPDEGYGVRDFKAKFGGTLVEHGRFLCIAKPLFYRLGKLGVSFIKRFK